MRRHVVVLGVAGCGKSTVGAAVARALGLPFAEGDDFHSPAARAKMAAGTPLTDEDRWPWLDRLADWMTDHAGTGSVVACSALRRAYRDRLRRASGDVVFVHLKVPPELLRSRLENRPDHFMPASLLESQLATLEPLMPEEGFSCAADGAPAEAVHVIEAWFRSTE